MVFFFIKIAVCPNEDYKSTDYSLNILVRKQKAGGIRAKSRWRGPRGKENGLKGIVKIMMGGTVRILISTKYLPCVPKMEGAYCSMRRTTSPHL
ncbi:MAG: hypothetical protein B1H12_07530 [Desulfobacteraceae bacterium 4484_190.2]|nr:MAG: hypothetical protein B1H12_07530 [Desulfobacteraceae bacterium 4484_190.2]